jgi:divalent metal cation (Fe/Co/Zn/Cd) transporter
MMVSQLPSVERARHVRRGIRLEYFTVVYNCLEGMVALLAGFLAGSVALVGFGLDSAIEVSSGAVLLWRLRADAHEIRRERSERLALRLVGICFIALAGYVGYEAVGSLMSRSIPERSVVGIVLAAVSLVVMPLLAKAKRRVAGRIDSSALVADARQAQFCTYLSAVLLGGLLLNALFGWWWADPAAGLIMVPVILKEGVDGLRGKTCCATCS